MAVISKRITLPKELVDWTEEAIKQNLVPGVRSLSGMCEKALYEFMNKTERK